MSDFTNPPAENDLAICRGCGRRLKGQDYRYGQPAYIPETNERAKVNFYGGFVCSRACDYRASLVQEQSMPGGFMHNPILSCYAQQSLERNWSE
jgi:hypothetical protein